MVEWLIGFLILCAICAVTFLRNRKNKKDKTLERIDVVEKDIDAEARFFISAVYQSGRVMLITPKALTEEQVVEESLKFIENNS